MQKVEAACVLLNGQAGNVRVRTGAHDHNKEEAQDHRAGRELALTALHKQMQYKRDDFIGQHMRGRVRGRLVWRWLCSRLLQGPAPCRASSHCWPSSCPP